MRYISFWLSATLGWLFISLLCALTLFWDISQTPAPGSLQHDWLYVVGVLLGFIGLMVSGTQLEKYMVVRLRFIECFGFEPPGVGGFLVGTALLGQYDLRIETRLGELSWVRPEYKFDMAHSIASRFGFMVMKTREDYRFLFTARLP